MSPKRSKTREGVAVLEHAGAVVGARRGGQDVELVVQADDSSSTSPRRHRRQPRHVAGRRPSAASPQRSRPPAAVAGAATVARRSAARRPRRSRAPCARAEKRSLEVRAAAPPVSSTARPMAADRLVDVVDDEAGDAVVDHLRHRAAAGRRSPACRRPSPRSSPGRTARASRSGTAAPRVAQELVLLAPRRSRPRTRRSGSSEQRLDLAARSSRGRRRRPWRRSSAACPAAARSRWRGRRASRARCGPETPGSSPRRRAAAEQIAAAGRDGRSPCQFSQRQRRRAARRRSRPAARRGNVRYSGTRSANVEPAVQGGHAGHRRAAATAGSGGSRCGSGCTSKSSARANTSSSMRT